MSEFVKDVSDSSFEKDVLTADKPVLVIFGPNGARPVECLRLPLRPSQSIMVITLMS